MKKIHVLGGGTFSHVRSHLALATPAFGETARSIARTMTHLCENTEVDYNYEVVLHLTKMADPQLSKLVTNEDVSKLLDTLIADPDTRGIVFNVALTDFDGDIGVPGGPLVPRGKYATRLQSRASNHVIHLTAAEKLIGRIRKERKDIFVVGFKTTTAKGPEDQYAAGLRLLKENSLNLVLANDLTTRNNILIAPEETQYFNGFNRKEALEMMCKMMLSRMGNTFTRSTVVDGEAVRWNDVDVPQNLRKVVNHCIQKGAYKPVLGKTAGHFAVKLDETTFLTSARKTNYNSLNDVGLVRVVSTGPDSVLAYGRKPSVGGQSQRQIFSEHPEADCIVHFHCPVLPGADIPVAEQWPNECGSHECGKNTSDHLKTYDLGDGHSLKVVMLDKHGPNIVYNHEVPAAKVIEFIDRNFDLSKKTGGAVYVN
jgi:hypothetical protein